MRKKDIKPTDFLSCQSSFKLLWLLCLFFSFNASAQIFQNHDTQIFIDEKAIVTNQLLQNISIDSTSVYIAKGTIVTNLQSKQYSEINNNSEHSKKSKISLTKTNFKEEKIIAKQEAKEEKTVSSKEIIVADTHRSTFFSSYNNTVVVPTTTQNIKLLAFFPKEAKNNITTNATSKKLIFENINLVLLSICLTVNSIRPPPFI